MNFNLLALIEAGLVKQDDNVLGIIQNIEPQTAHAICKWLVLATGKEARLRLMAPGEIEEIHYTPEQLEQLMRRDPQQAEDDTQNEHDANRQQQYRDYNS